MHEATVTGRLEHPGIVPIYGLGRYPDGRPYYVMRFIQGETLKEAINRFHGPDAQRQESGEREVAFRRLLQAIVAACNAIAYAHLRGVVHRDLKPENIMLGPFGETLVVDWGMAKSFADLEQAGGGLGALVSRRERRLADPHRRGGGNATVHEPRASLGRLERVGPASDVYGLGATLYCLLVGHAPFPDGDLSDILDRVQRGIFPAPRRLRRAIDPALEAICLKAMALRPQDRHASALELGGEIEAWLADVRYRGEQVRALNQVKGSLCRLCIERAQNLFGRGMKSEGMLWLARALENVPADSRKLERVVRSSLGSWYARDRLLERSLHHGGEVHAVAFSPDGRRLATACADALARLWDVATGHPLVPELEHDGPVLAAGLQPRRQEGGNGGCRRQAPSLERPTGKPIGQAGPPRPADHRRPVQPGWVADRHGVPGHRSLASGKRRRRRPVNRPVGNDAPVCSIAFSPRGNLLAAACEDGRVLCWETTTGSLHRRTSRSLRPGHVAGVSCRRADAPHRLPRWQGTALGSGRDDDRARVRPGVRRGSGWL